MAASLATSGVHAISVKPLLHPPTPLLPAHGTACLASLHLPAIAVSPNPPTTPTPPHPSPSLPPTQAMARPAYSAVSQHARDGKPAIVFVPTRKHARMTALDLLTQAAAEGTPFKFRQAEEGDLAPYLERVQVRGWRVGWGGGAVSSGRRRRVTCLPTSSGRVWVGEVWGALPCPRLPSFRPVTPTPPHTPRTPP